MKRKSLVFAVLAAAVSAAVVAAVSFAAGGGSSTRSVTFHLIEKGQAFHFVDNPPSGGATQTASLGDMFVFTSNLFTTSGKRAGVIGAYCVITAGGQKNTRSECTGSFSLAGGELDGIVAVRGQGNVTQIAIVGGTGAYEGARGTVVSVSKPNSNITRDTVHLVLP